MNLLAILQILNLNDMSLEIYLWARSSAWLERSTDNRKVMSPNLIGPTRYVQIHKNGGMQHY